MVMVVAPRIPQGEPEGNQTKTNPPVRDQSTSSADVDTMCNRTYHVTESQEDSSSSSESSSSAPPRPPTPTDEENGECQNCGRGENRERDSSFCENRQTTSRSQSGCERPLHGYDGPETYSAPPRLDYGHYGYGQPFHYPPPPPPPPPPPQPPPSHYYGFHGPPHHYDHHGHPPPPPPPPHHPHHRYGHPWHRHGPPFHPPPPPPPPPPPFLPHYYARYVHMNSEDHRGPIHPPPSPPPPAPPLPPHRYDHHQDQGHHGPDHHNRYEHGALLHHPPPAPPPTPPLRLNRYSRYGGPQHRCGQQEYREYDRRDDSDYCELCDCEKERRRSCDGNGRWTELAHSVRGGK